MKKLLTTLLIVVLLTTCEKEELDEIPDYKPGRLLEIIWLRREWLDDITCHKYEYSNNEVTDNNSKYYFINNKLEKVTNDNFTKIYFYDESIITEIQHRDGFPYDTAYYYIENNEIYYYEDIDIDKYGDNYMKFFYKWEGNNLVEYNYKRNHWMILQPFEEQYSYEYTNIENPFFYCNIPLLETDKTHVSITITKWLDLIPKCSKNLPSNLTMPFDKYYADDPDKYSYSFEYKTFQDVNKPYEVKITKQTIKDGIPNKYFEENTFAFNYEKL